MTLNEFMSTKIDQHAITIKKLFAGKKKRDILKWNSYRLRSLIKTVIAIKTIILNNHGCQEEN